MFNVLSHKGDVDSNFFEISSQVTLSRITFEARLCNLLRFCVKHTPNNNKGARIIKITYKPILIKKSKLVFLKRMRGVGNYQTEGNICK